MSNNKACTFYCRPPWHDPACHAIAKQSRDEKLEEIALGCLGTSLQLDLTSHLKSYRLVDIKQALQMAYLAGQNDCNSELDLLRKVAQASDALEQKVAQYTDDVNLGIATPEDRESLNLTQEYLHGLIYDWKRQK